jgi:hypothetical protein
MNGAVALAVSSVIIGIVVTITTLLYALATGEQADFADQGTFTEYE